MKKFVNVFAIFLLIAVPLSIGNRVFAQTLDDTEVPTMEQVYDLNSTLGNVKSDDYGSMNDLSNTSISNDQLASFTQIATLMSGGARIFSLLFSIAIYVFTALTLQKVAQKLGYKYPWHAWVPLLNAAQLIEMGDKSPWLLLLVIIPILGWFALFVIFIIVQCRIAEKLGYDKLLGLLTLVPLGAFIMWGMFAWGKKGQPVARQTSSLNPGTLVDANPAPTILPLVEEQPVVPQYAEPIPQPVPNPQPAPAPQVMPTPTPTTPTPQPTIYTPPTFTPPQNPPTPVVPSQM